MDTKGFLRWLLVGIAIILLAGCLAFLAEGGVRHWGWPGLAALVLAGLSLLGLAYKWADSNGKRGRRGVTFSDNTGDSVEDAIVISGASGHPAGVAAEYLYLGKKFGRRGKDWELDIQSVLTIDDKHYDEMRLIFPDGTSTTVYFDLTDFFGRLPGPS